MMFFRINFRIPLIMVLGVLASNTFTAEIGVTSYSIENSKLILDSLVTEEPVVLNLEAVNKTQSELNEILKNLLQTESEDEESSQGTEIEAGQLIRTTTEGIHLDAYLDNDTSKYSSPILRSSEVVKFDSCTGDRMLKFNFESIFRNVAQPIIMTYEEVKGNGTNFQQLPYDNSSFMRVAKECSIVLLGCPGSSFSIFPNSNTTYIHVQLFRSEMKNYFIVIKQFDANYEQKFSESLIEVSDLRLLNCTSFIQADVIEIHGYNSFFSMKIQNPHPITQVFIGNFYYDLSMETTLYASHDVSSRSLGIRNISSSPKLHEIETPSNIPMNHRVAYEAHKAITNQNEVASGQEYKEPNLFVPRFLIPYEDMDDTVRAFATQNFINTYPAHHKLTHGNLEKIESAIRKLAYIRKVNITVYTQLHYTDMDGKFLSNYSVYLDDTYNSPKGMKMIAPKYIIKTVLNREEKKAAVVYISNNPSKGFYPSYNCSAVCNEMTWLRTEGLVQDPNEGYYCCFKPENYENYTLLI